MTARDAFDGLLVVVTIGALLFAYAVVGKPEFEDELILEQHIAEADQRHEFPPCEGATLKSWAAGERWAPKGEDVQAECAPRAKTLPPYLMSIPCDFDGERCR